MQLGISESSLWEESKMWERESIPVWEMASTKQVFADHTDIH